MRTPSIPPETPTLLTGLASRLCKLCLLTLSHARFLHGIDLPWILTNHTETSLNLPGTLSFFPTRPTNQDTLAALIRRLHPVRCNKDLIRLGPDEDGGYLVPDDLHGIVACFSPGVSTLIGFERACAQLGMRVFMADASIEHPPDVHPQFEFIKRFVGSTTDRDFISLEEWVNASNVDPHADLLLQMDIEGGEYETLLSIPKDLQMRFRIIVVEFHHLHYLFSDPLFSIYSKALEKLLSTHSCVHIHPNNVRRAVRVGTLEIPQIAEFTFLRNDRISHPLFPLQFPHPLDRDNVPNAPLYLPQCWYRTQ